MPASGVPVPTGVRGVPVPTGVGGNCVLGVTGGRSAVPIGGVNGVPTKPVANLGGLTPGAIVSGLFVGVGGAVPIGVVGGDVGVTTAVPVPGIGTVP